MFCSLPQSVVFLLHFIDGIFLVLTLAIFARSLLSFFPNIRPGSPFYLVAVLSIQITEPILAPLRRVVPMVGMFDISPWIALLVMQFVLQPLIKSAIISAVCSGRGF
jgi:YggT family protein